MIVGEGEANAQVNYQLVAEIFRAFASPLRDLLGWQKRAIAFDIVRIGERSRVKLVEAIAFDIVRTGKRSRVKLVEAIAFDIVRIGERSRVKLVKRTHLRGR